MAKRHVYSKDSTGYGDFVYVDLLPEVRRSTQFNVNVIIALLYAISLLFFFVYQPYSKAVFELEDLTAIYNDYQHEYTLTQEEFDGYEIDLEAIQFEQDLENAEELRVDFNNLADTIELLVSINGGRVRSVSYNADESRIVVDVSNVEDISFNLLYSQLLNYDWVAGVEKTEPIRYGGEVEYTATFTIEVNYNAE